METMKATFCGSDEVSQDNLTARMSNIIRAVFVSDGNMIPLGY